MTDVCIRPATPDDLPGILAIYNDAIARTTAVYRDTPSTLEERAEWLEARRQQGFPVLVAELHGGVAGFGSYGPFRAWPGYRFTVEHSVYVAAERRRRGVGLAIVQALVAGARAQGMHALVAGVDADNAASIALHQALGFAQVARFRQVGFKFGRWLDLCFLELLL
jgi:phosphinothricin acetyltransferase